MASVTGARRASGRGRIAPGSRREIGVVNMAVARLLGVATGGGPPNLFTTLARHRRLFRRWLCFAGALMPGGRLPRADTELLILRVAANCDCGYEWRHHERLAGAAGLSAEQIAAARDGADAGCFDARQRSLLRAADELHAERDLSDGLWQELRGLLSDVDLIEVCMLVGHYEMLAMTLNALRVEPDAVKPGGPPRIVRAVQRGLERRGRSRQ